METKKKVPEIRFAGFTEDWRIKKVLDVAPLQRGYDLLQSQIVSGKYPVVMSNGVSYYHSEFIAKGPGVITGRSGTIGNVHFIESDYWPHNTSLWVTDFKDNHPFYVYKIFQNLDLSRFGTGSGVPTLNRNDVHDQIIYLPEIEEQKKISGFLKNLDDLLKNHQTQLTKLKNLKKAMLTKMFPQNGATVPVIRFKGFNEEWGLSRLDKIAEIIGGGTPSTTNPNYWNGNINWYSPTEINDKPYKDKSLKKITPLGLANCSATILPANRTILFTSRAGIGKMAILKNEGSTNQGFQSLVLNKNIDIYFIYSAGYLIKKYALSQASGSTFLEISGKSLGEMPILVPNEDEQKKIGTYFKNLDDLITNHQEQLKKLNNIKKACLNKLFVA